jgi:hypothetical protein
MTGDSAESVAPTDQRQPTMQVAERFPSYLHSCVEPDGKGRAGRSASSTSHLGTKRFALKSAEVITYHSQSCGHHEH